MIMHSLDAMFSIAQIANLRVLEKKRSSNLKSTDMKPLPKLNERLLVQNINYAKAYVIQHTWLETEHRFELKLRWEALDGTDLGMSKVYDTDEGKTWFRWNEVN